MTVHPLRSCQRKPHEAQGLSQLTALQMPPEILQGRVGQPETAVSLDSRQRWQVACHQCPPSPGQKDNAPRQCDTGSDQTRAAVVEAQATEAVDLPNVEAHSSQLMKAATRPAGLMAIVKMSHGNTRHLFQQNCGQLHNTWESCVVPCRSSILWAACIVPFNYTTYSPTAHLFAHPCKTCSTAFVRFWGPSSARAGRFILLLCARPNADLPMPDATCTFW